MNIPEIGQQGIEQSFSFGDLVRYGLSDSVRTDVILRNDNTGEILAVWDIKTSKERLEPKRVAEIRGNLNIGDNVPVIEIHVNLGISFKEIMQKSTVLIHQGAVNIGRRCGQRFELYSMLDRFSHLLTFKRTSNDDGFLYAVQSPDRISR